MFHESKRSKSNMCSVSNHRVKYWLFHLISFLVRKFTINGQFLQIFGRFVRKIFSPGHQVEKLAVYAWTYSYRFEEILFDLLYSYAHLVHSFVAETHCKLYFFYPLIMFRFRWLAKTKEILKNVVSIDNYYLKV